MASVKEMENGIEFMQQKRIYRGAGFIDGDWRMPICLGGFFLLWAYGS
jgi:hypothetical protein